ncbi:MAG: hypothetical protein ACREM1_09850 [Longimicrobiales bacterium]
MIAIAPLGTPRAPWVSAWRRTSHFLLSWLIITGGCRADDSQRAAASTSREALPLEIQWADSIVIEEEPPVVLVQPEVSIDPHGGFLIADEREARIHRFGFDGVLEWTAGGRGGGPGEFRSVVAVRRLPGGEIIAADRNATVTVFDSIAKEILLAQKTGLTRVEDMEVLDSSRIVLAGASGGDPALERIHVYDFRASAILGSFFRALDGVNNLDAASVAGWVELSVRSDTIAAIFSVKDTLFLFDRSGASVRRIPIATTNFRRVYAQPPSGPQPDNPSRMAEWLSTFDLVADIHWLDQNRLLVPYQSIGPTEALERTWHLLVVSSDGRHLWELRDATRPLVSDSTAGTIIFVSPNSMTPERWSVGHLQLEVLQ